MARTPIPKRQRAHSLLAVIVYVLFALAVADSRRIAPPLIVTLVVYGIGVIASVVAWLRDFRWKSELHTIGMLATVYSLVVWMFAGQFLLALGAFCLFIIAIVFPVVRGQIRQQIRDGLLRTRQEAGG